MIRFKVTTLDDKSCVTSKRDEGFTKLYKDNTIIEADKSTIGLMIFKTKKAALCFIEDYKNSIYSSWKVKRVIPLDKGKTPRWIAFCYRIFEFNNSMKEYGIPLCSDSASPPSGTICHFKIKVIGDCK